MSIYDTLNEQQREAVFHTEGPLLILAGAGSGKTRVLTHRIAYLIEEQQVNPWNILAITFTNKAAGEMRERVDKLVGYGSESIWVSTFHSMCVRILRRHIDLLGYDTNFTIYDSDDQKTLMREVCKLLQVDTKMFRERALLSEISKAKDELVTPQEYRMRAEGDYSRKKIAEVYEEYEKQLRSNNALDFDDLLFKTVQLFQTQKDVLEYYQERFRYIMVDEYQDTNTVQFELIHLLASKYRNLCVVGDDDQSIYKFRGANIKNILDFEHVFDDTKVIKLEQNYRSTGNILNAANAVIRNNHGRKEKTLWTENEDGNMIQFRQFDSAYEEAEYVVGDIRRHVNKELCSYKDNAVLYRTNAQSRMFEERFVRDSIPYKVIGGVNFYARREIKDLLAYLKTIDNGRDDLAVRRIVNVPKRGIGLTSINRVQEYASSRECSFYDALRAVDLIPNIGRGQAKLESFVAMIEHFKNDEFWKDYLIGYQPPSMDYMIFNQNDTFMADVNVRKAVQAAINRDLINQNFYNGEGTLLNGVLPPAIPGYSEDQTPIKYDVEEAKKLLKEAGHESDVTLTILQNGESTYTHPINEMIQSMLGEAGIKAEIKNMDMTSYWDTIASGEGYSISLGPVTADVPDPGAFFTTFTVENSASNGYNIKDKALSDKIKEANAKLDPKERIAALQALESEIVTEQALYLPIAAEKRTCIISPRLKNFQLGWQGWVCCSTHNVEIDDSYNK